MNKNEIVKILQENAGLSIVGIFENTLTALINRVDDMGGYSVHVVDDEIRIYQHPDAGENEFVIPIKPARGGQP